MVAPQEHSSRGEKCQQSKVFEMVLENNIPFYVINVISIDHHGSMQGRSSITNLIEITWLITENIDRTAYKIYTDLDHRVILNKLSSFDFSQPIVEFLHSYLVERNQHVQGVCSISMGLPLVSRKVLIWTHY